MIITIKPNKFVATLKDFVKNTRTMFNFQIVDNILNLEVLNNYTAISRIPCENIEGYIPNFNASIWLTKSILVLDCKSDIKITFTDKVVVIEQDTFSGVFTREYEDRRFVPDVSNVKTEQLLSARLKYFAKLATGFSSLAKELSISEPDPVFKDDVFYLDYAQTWFLAQIDFPTACMPMATLKDFTTKLDEQASYYVFTDIDTLYIKTFEYDFFIPIVNSSINENSINAVNKIGASLKELTKINIKPYVEKLQTIVQAFPKTKFPLMIGNNEFSINVNANNQRISIGSVNTYLTSITITSAQLDVICKLFKDDEQINVLRGVNCLCLESKGKTVLLAGLL